MAHFIMTSAVMPRIREEYLIGLLDHGPNWTRPNTANHSYSDASITRENAGSESKERAVKRRLRKGE